MTVIDGFGPFLQNIGDFETRDSGSSRRFDSGAVRDERAGKGRYDLLPPLAIARLAKVYERGAEKYGDRNWEKGMPESDLLDSALRHCFQYQQGLRDEDHLMHAVFNLLAAVEFQERAAIRPDPPSEVS